MATPRANSYVVAAGEGVYAGFPPPAPPSVIVGAWERLSFASHSRKVGIGVGSNENKPVFDPTYAVSVDAISPTSTTGVPWKSFCRPVPGEPGIVYWAGSLHGNYPGNEIDRIDVRNLGSTTITTTLSHQPRVSPEGPDSGYGSGSGGYVFAQYGTALADGSTWQPYAHHHWTKSSWHPTWGFTMQVVGAKGDGLTVGANPLGAGTQYQQATTSAGGAVMPALVSYEWTEAKYRVRIQPVVRPDGDPVNIGAGGPGLAGASDWNQHLFSTLYLTTLNSVAYVREHVDTASTVTTGGDWNFNTATLSGTGQGWLAATSGNGVLLRHLEGGRYLGLRCDNTAGIATFDACHTLWLMNSISGYSPSRTAPLKLTVPSTYLQPPASGGAMSITADGNLMFCVDKNSRRVIWLTYRGPAGAGQTLWYRIWVSTFDDLMTWTEVTTTGGPTIVQGATDGFEGSWFASVRAPMWFYNGHLFVIFPTRAGVGGYADGAIDVWRLKIDGGAIPPATTFTRLDYWAQNPATNGFRFSHIGVSVKQMIGTKHVNWAYRPADATYYQCAGDFGHSFCQSMCKMAFDGTARGYTFTEVLAELTLPAAGKVRPSSPDDGHWFYVPTDSAWIAARGKFVFLRGGDGTGMFGNTPLRALYGASSEGGTGAQVAAALADGWSLMEKFLLFDPAEPDGFTNLGPTFSHNSATNTFSVSNYNGWTQDNGGNAFDDVWTVGSAATRCGAFDPVTGHVWRFYAGRLARFDMLNKAVRVYNISVWTSPETGRAYTFDGSMPPNAAAVVADGTKPLFGFYDTPNTRWKTFGAFEWEHKATWLDPTTGFLYVVSPGTGYLWRFDTRGTLSTHVASSGWRMTFGPIGQRVPFVTCYPALNSLDRYPPEAYLPGGGDVRMNGLLLPWKGGLLHITPNHHGHGASGEPHYSFWRALGDVGPWTVVTLPQEFAANAGAARDAYDINNPELMLISQAFTDVQTRQNYRYFWRLT